MEAQDLAPLKRHLIRTQCTPYGKLGATTAVTTAKTGGVDGRKAGATLAMKG